MAKAEDEVGKEKIKIVSVHVNATKIFVRHFQIQISFRFFRPFSFYFLIIIRFIQQIADFPSKVCKSN